jgi:hypothetical protein
MQIQLSTLTPVEHDLLYMERQRIQFRAGTDYLYAEHGLICNYGKELRWSKGRYERDDVAVIDYRTDPVPTEFAQARLIQLNGLQAEAMFNDGVVGKWGGMPTREAERFTEARIALEDANRDVYECNSEYRSRPWKRYFLVTSSDGHIHSSTECSTCNKGVNATEFALVPYLSGSSADVAVADLGSALCSVCFPDAPVESREQVKISARVALVLAEQGVEAFQQAREKARANAVKRAGERCEGSGQPTIRGDRWHNCPVCGYAQRADGKSRAHRRPRFYATKEVGYDTKYWNGTTWAPSTKKIDLLTREQAQAIVDAHGGGRVIQD